jgi:hypothetical protein
MLQKQVVNGYKKDSVQLLEVLKMPYSGRKTPNPIGAGISAGLQSYNEHIAKQEMERKAANFDKLPKVEQALFLAKYAGQPAAAAHVKSMGIAEAGQNFLAKARAASQGGNQSQNILPGDTKTPNVNQLHNAMQATDITNQLQAPTPMNALAAGRANQPGEDIRAQNAPPAQPEQEQDIFSGLSDAQLKEGIFEAPELKDTIEKELTRRQQDRHEENERNFKQNLFNQQTQREIQKENRARIREFSKPYENIQPLQKNLSDLEKAKNLIQTGQVSFDENKFRGIVTGILDAKNQSELAEYLKTPGQQKLFSLLKNSLKTKEIGGSNPSTREVLIALSAIPSGMKGKDANLFIIDNMINDAKLNYEKSRIINQLSKDENLSYGDFLERVNEHLSPIQQQLDQEYDKKEMINSARQFIKGKQPKHGYVFMVNPQTGEPREALAKDVQAAQAAGGILLNE